MDVSRAQAVSESLRIKGWWYAVLGGIGVLVALFMDTSVQVGSGPERVTNLSLASAQIVLLVASLAGEIQATLFFVGSGLASAIDGSLAEAFDFIAQRDVALEGRATTVDSSDAPPPTRARSQEAKFQKSWTCDCGTLNPPTASACVKCGTRH